MAWVMIDKNENELIFNDIPIGLCIGCFCNLNDDNRNCKSLNRIILPKGSIKKLTGKDLTWKDNPIEI